VALEDDSTGSSGDWLVAATDTFVGIDELLGISPWTRFETVMSSIGADCAFVLKVMSYYPEAKVQLPWA